MSLKIRYLVSMLLGRRIGRDFPGLGPRVWGVGPNPISGTQDLGSHHTDPQTVQQDILEAHISPQ